MAESKKFTRRCRRDPAAYELDYIQREGTNGNNHSDLPRKANRQYKGEICISMYEDSSIVDGGLTYQSTQARTRG